MTTHQHRDSVRDTFDPIDRLKKDLREAAATLSEGEVRYLVDAYYQMQDNRIIADGQIRSMTDEPHRVIGWLSENTARLERTIKTVLDTYTSSQRLGRWAKSIVGIGPVLAAGLQAHIDIKKAPTVGHIWRYAGLDPTVEWKKKTKRPWNARLKVITWKIGESFVKTSGRPNDIYGHLWATRKHQEQTKNEAGAFAEQAAAKLEKFTIGTKTDAYAHYQAGRLPPAHLHARAKRWAVKLFLAHWHHVAYEIAHGTPPPKPYVIEHLGHAHLIGPPNWPDVQ